MITDVFFAKKGQESLIAYHNLKNQNVFIGISKSDFAPSIKNVMICDNSYNLEKIITNCFECAITYKKKTEIGIKKRHIWKPLLASDTQHELDFDIPIFEGEQGTSGCFSSSFKFQNGQVVSNIFDIIKAIPLIEK